MENGRFAFLSPSLGCVGTTYDVHLKLIGKRVADFLLVLIELFWLGVTAEALRVNISAFHPPWDGKMSISLRAE